MKDICAEPFINLFKLCADIRVVFWSPRNLEKSVGANNEKGNECICFLSPCLYLQNTVNVENCNICGFLKVHIILNEKSFITLLSLAQFMKSWYLWKSNIMNIIYNFPESSRVHGNFWGCVFFFFLLLAKEAKEKIFRYGTSFVFSLLMKCGRQCMHTPLIFMWPRFEVEMWF